MAFGDLDLDVFYQDGDPVTVTSNGNSFMAHFTVPEKLESFGSLNVKTPEISGAPQIEFSMDAATAAGLAHGSAISVRGVAYKVRNMRRQGDGQVGVADLRLP